MLPLPYLILSLTRHADPLNPNLLTKTLISI